jgi:glucose-1-phosphate thymidylyltransferase
MKALILAAGYATRLYPLTKEYPKPLLTVGEKPLIDHIVAKLEAVEDIDEIIVVTNSKFIAQFEKWLSPLAAKKNITLVDDLTKTLEDRRGAIGDMYFAIESKQIKEDLLVIGGDNLFDGGLDEYLQFANAHKSYPVIGAYDIKDRAQAQKYGVITVDAANKIVDFQEKPEKPNSTLVAMCLYYFPKEKLRLVEEYMASRADKHDATGFYISWLSKKESVYAFTFKGRWYDIGDPDFYKEAKGKFTK